MNGLNAIKHLNEAAVAQSQARRICDRVIAEHGLSLGEADMVACIEKIAPALYPSGTNDGVLPLARTDYELRARAYAARATA